MAKTQVDLPATVDAAVRLLLAIVDEANQAEISAMADDDLYRLHFGLGMWIRNNMGFYAGNTKLLKDTGEADPDDASIVIIRAFRDRMISEKPKTH